MKKLGVGVRVRIVKTINTPGVPGVYYPQALGMEGVIVEKEIQWPQIQWGVKVSGLSFYVWCESDELEPILDQDPKFADFMQRITKIDPAQPALPQTVHADKIPNDVSKRFTKYNFRDEHGHSLLMCQDFIDLF